MREIDRRSALSVVKSMEREETPVEVQGHRRILLFDGICNLCSWAFHFIARRDSRSLFTFAWVQSEVGSRLMGWCGLPTEEYETMVYIEDGVPYFKSTAFLRAARHLRFPWPVLAVGLVIPRWVRDWVYDRVAQHRYTISGRREKCLIPRVDLLERFL